MPPLLSNLALGAQIAAGFFGEVFLANEAVLGEVAVKVLRQSPGQSATDWSAQKADLVREGQRLVAATHRNVVQVHGVLESASDDAVHLVMEYCRGGSLQERFAKGPMRLAEIRKYATDVTHGLQALHSRGMIHRDIKPGNLLLDGNGVAKLGDFGLVTDNIILGYASQAGYSDHIAYEVWHGAGTSVRSDIWAFGMTIYRLLHGASWYSRKPPPSAIVRDGGFANTLRWLPHVPKPWRRFARRMLNDDPHARHENAIQVIDALATLPTGPNIICDVSPVEIRWRWRTDTRKFFVVWRRLSKRMYEWEAWSEPVGAGNRRTLGGSSQLNRVNSERELEDFFISHS